MTASENSTSFNVSISMETIYLAYAPHFRESWFGHPSQMAIRGGSIMRNISGPLLILIAALSWSTAGLFTRLVTTDIPTTLLWRSITGGICVLLIYYAMNQKKPLRNLFVFSFGEFWIAGLTTAGMICFISSFFFTTIANVSFVYGTMPLVTYFLSLIFLREKISAFSIVCCVASTLGMVIMTLGNAALNDYLGIALALGMTFFMAALTVATKFFPNADTTKATYLSAFLGALAVAPFATHTLLLTSDYVWLGLYGLVNVGLGFGVYLMGVSRVSALAAALIGLIEIPLAPVWAWMLFAEKTTGLVLIGGSLITTTAIVYIIGTRKN